jgi:GT2 family glycosyltransferase
MTVSSHQDAELGIVVYNSPLDKLKKTFESIAEAQKKFARLKTVHILCNNPDRAYQEELGRLVPSYGFAFIGFRPNHGFGAAHNEIIRLVTAKWYICCNPDIEINSQTLPALLDFGEKLPNPGLLMPKVFSIDGSIQPLARRHITLETWLARQLWRMFPKHFVPYEIAFDYSRTQPIEFVTGCFFAAQTSLLRTLNGFDEAFFLYAEDADLSRRSSKIAQNYYVSESYVIHHWGMAWSKSFRSFRQNISSIFRYFSKHGFSAHG